MSIVFDRAVDFYDQTRAISPEFQDLAFGTLIRETGITPDARVLEIGIGTGRIAIPMSERIHRIFGVDLSLGMMGKLQEKLRQSPHSIFIAQADVTQLPFSNTTFDFVYGVHVLHLVKGWQDAVAEAWRVLKPGGFFVVNYHHRDALSPNVLLRNQLHALVEPRGISTKRPGAQSEDEIQQELTKWTANTRVVPVSDWTEQATPNEELYDIAHQIHSETWAIPREAMDEVMPSLREWAVAHYGDLDQPHEVRGNYSWLIAQKE